MSVSISLYHDTRYAKKNNRYPVKLRVSNQVDAPLLYATIYDLTEQDFQRLKAPHVNETLDKIKKGLKSMEANAIIVAEAMGEFSFYKFERDFVIGNPLLKLNKVKSMLPPEAIDDFDCQEYLDAYPILNEDVSDPLSLSACYVKNIKELLKINGFGNADNFQDSYFSFKAFFGNIHVADITKSRLIDYEQHLLKKGLSLVTVGIKVRHFRAIFNDTIADGKVHNEKYPFGRRKYVIPYGERNKKALPMSITDKIYFYEPKNNLEWFGKDLWIFIYQGNGMNPKDLACLKYSNMDGDFLEFSRAKTRNTARRNLKKILVYLTDDMRAIIERWGNKDKSPDNFIFPILNHELTPLQQHKMIKSFLGKFRRMLKPIAKAIEVPKILPSEARHSYATHLKQKGATIEFISEGMGHYDIKTTQGYTGDFERVAKMDFAKMMIPVRTDILGESTDNCM